MIQCSGFLPRLLILDSSGFHVLGHRIVPPASDTTPDVHGVSRETCGRTVLRVEISAIRRKIPKALFRPLATTFELPWTQLRNEPYSGHLRPRMTETSMRTCLRRCGACSDTSCTLTLLVSRETPRLTIGLWSAGLPPSLSRITAFGLGVGSFYSDQDQSYPTLLHSVSQAQGPQFPSVSRETLPYPFTKTE